MAHFAELDNNNIVLRVVVISDSDTSDAKGQEKEYIGQAFCEKMFGGNWVKTSFNGTMRKNYAGPGYKYDKTRDAFIPPRPLTEPLWVLNEETCQWEPPPIPDDYDQSKKWEWDGTQQQYVELTRQMILNRLNMDQLTAAGIQVDENGDPIDEGQNIDNVLPQ